MKVEYYLLFTALFLVGCLNQELAEPSDVVISDTNEEPANVTVEETPPEIPVETVETDTNESVDTEIPDTPLTNREIITIENLKFNPKDIEIARGTTVIWLHQDKYSNSDAIKHIIRVYLKGGSFNLQSPGLYYGESFNYTFTQPGEYYYISVVYADRGSRGSITVG